MGLVPSGDIYLIIFCRAFTFFNSFLNLRTSRKAATQSALGNGARGLLQVGKARETLG